MPSIKVARRNVYVLVDGDVLAIIPHPLVTNPTLVLRMRTSTTIAFTSKESLDVLTVISKKIDEWQKSPTAKAILGEMVKRLMQVQQPTC